MVEAISEAKRVFDMRRRDCSARAARRVRDVRESIQRRAALSVRRSARRTRWSAWRTREAPAPVADGADPCYARFIYVGH
jgi:hypothetical protein